MTSRPHLRPSADNVEQAMPAYARKMGDELEDAARSGRS